jgi:septation ring formation regulator EzrA
MSTLTDNDLTELKDLINSKFEQVNEKIDSRFEQVDSRFLQVNDKLNDMRVEIASIKGNQEGFGKRLDNLEFTNRGIFISIVGGSLIAMITLIVKFLAPTINF